MNKIIASLFFSAITTIAIAQTYSGPESFEYDPIGNRYFISNTTSGQILARDASGNLSVFASGVSPSAYGIEMLFGNLYAACGGKVYGYNMSGTQIFNVNLGGQFLNGITHDNNGNLYVTDFNGYKIYKVNIATSTVSVFVSGLPAKPNGIIWDEGQNRLVLVSWGSNVAIKAVSLVDSSVTTLVTTTLSNCDGIAEDGAGNFYISNWGANSVVKYNNDFTSSQVTVMTGLSSPADIYYNIYTDTLAVPNSGNNTVVFQSFAPATSIIVCNDVPLTLYTDSTTWGASDGFVSGTDSMIHCVIRNTSNYEFAYPKVKFNFLDPLPTGTTLETNSQGYLVIASAWNPGNVSSVNCYFHVASPIPAGYPMRFTLSVTNLPPSNVDTCMFSDTFLFAMNLPNFICDCETFPHLTISPNPLNEYLFMNYDGDDAGSIEIFDVLGRKLKTEIVNSKHLKISMKEFSSGVYFISLLNVDGKIIQNKKIVKE